jgi:type II secretory pathway pseudopilin PulG
MAFSLVEVLIAIGVGAIIFAALYSGISSSFSLLQNVRENLRATQIMVSRLEGVRLCAWSDEQLFNTNIVPRVFTESFYPQGLEGGDHNGTIYAGTMEVQQSPSLSPAPSYAANMALVKVTVTWTNGYNGKINVHTRSMSTYVAKYGIQNYVYYH